MKVETIEDLKNLVGKKVYLGRRIAKNNFDTYELEVESIVIGCRIYKGGMGPIEVLIRPTVKSDPWGVIGAFSVDLGWLTRDEALDFIKEYERED